MHSPSLPCRAPIAARSPSRLLFASVLMLASAALPNVRAQLVLYSFGPAAAPTLTASAVAPGLLASDFGGNAGSPATGSGSPQYLAGSGGSYFTASAWSGAAPGANFFEFTLTPAAGYEFTVSEISFAYRATSSGPTSFAIRTSRDGFAADTAAGTFLADSTWYATGALPLPLSGLDTPTTFRLYASSASSSLGTLRIDDLSLAGAVSAVPEPSTWALLLGVGALATASGRRLHRHLRTKKPAGGAG